MVKHECLIVWSDHLAQELADLLKERGWTAAVIDSDCAMDRMRENGAVSVIVADGDDSLGLRSLVRAKAELKNSAKIVALFRDASTSKMWNVLEEGVTSFVKKPVNIKSLITQVENLVSVG